MAKTKILHIVNSLCVGGIERMAVSLCNDLDKDLFEVTLLLLSNNENPLKSHLSPTVQLIELESEMRLSGLREMWRLFGLRRKIDQVIKEINPDIIHTHSYFYAALPLFMVIHKSIDHTNHFHTIHTAGLHYAFNKQNAKNRCEERWFKRNKTTVICVSKEVQRRVKYLMPSIQTNFIPNYIGFKIVEHIEQQTSIDPSQTIRIVYLARLTEGKNHRRLLDAFAVVVENYPNAKLRLIGDGELREELEKKSIELSLEQYVEFCGHSDQIQQLLQQCDIGIFPSEYEGFSVALIEMMSAGLPICCSGIDNFKDLSIRGGDMLYFDPYDSRDIAKKVQLMISDNDLRKQLCVASLEIAKDYTREVLVPQYEKLYGARK